MEKETNELIRDTAKLAKEISCIAGVATDQLGDELQFIKTVHADLRAPMDALESRLLYLANNIASVVNDCRNDVDDLAEEYHPKVIDTLDKMLERIDCYLDEVHGISKRAEVSTREVVKKPVKKLHVEMDEDKIAIPASRQIFVPEAHPYEKIIKGLYKSVDNISQENAMVVTSLELETTPFEFIDTPEGLSMLVRVLQNESIIAVDLEGHTFHSYYGFTCLMQISTSSADYIVDTIALRRELGNMLGPIFADPSILKIFHGAQGDIQWLQRDFNIFVVNMFDTFIAAKPLGMPQRSLAYLLQRYCDVVTDKQYQLADWRMRPLPEEMVRYARMDTHYLLHIHGLMYKELVELGKEVALEVFKGSSNSALTLYKPDFFNPDGWKNLIGRSSVPFGEREIALIKTIYEWREQIARIEDVSAPAVLPNYLMIKLAQAGRGVGDPEVLLKGHKASYIFALKHIDELREIMATGFTVRLSENRGSISSVKTCLHIKFKEKEEEDADSHRLQAATKEKTVDDQPAAEVEEKNSDPVVPIVVSIASSNNSQQSRSSKILFSTSTRPTMADVFSNHSKRHVADAACKIVDIMSINKVAMAARQLLNEPPISDELETESSIERANNKVCESQEKEFVTILRTNEKIDAEEALMKTQYNMQDKMLSLGSDTRAKRVKLAEGDKFLEEASIKLFKEYAKTQDDSTATLKAKETKPKINNTERPNRLSVAPRSGNRTITFSR